MTPDHRIGAAAGAFAAAFIASQLVVGAALVTACSPDDTNDPLPDADTGALDGADVAADASASEDTTNLVEMWVSWPVPTIATLRAVAAVPGKVGHYVLVGDGATVFYFDGAVFSDRSPTNVGAADLRAVWVADDGTIVAGGTGSSLVVWDGTTWSQAGEIPPTPAVRFEDISGRTATDIWAVGGSSEPSQRAWHYDGEVWAPVAVSVTDGDSGPLPGKAEFVAVKAAADGVV